MNRLQYKYTAPPSGKVWHHSTLYLQNASVQVAASANMSKEWLSSYIKQNVPMRKFYQYSEGGFKMGGFERGWS